MTTANQKATRTYDIVNGGSREALLMQLQLLGRREIAKLEPFTFEVNNNLRTTKNGRRFIVPGKVEVYVDGIDFLRDINGHCDGDVVRIRGEIANDSSIPGAKGRFEAIYDTHYRGRKINQKFRHDVNVIELKFNNC